MRAKTGVEACGNSRGRFISRKSGGGSGPMCSPGTRAYVSSARVLGRSSTTRYPSHRRISVIQRSRSAKAISNYFVGIVTPWPTPRDWQQIAGLRLTMMETLSSVSFSHSKSGTQRQRKKRAERRADGRTRHPSRPRPRSSAWTWEAKPRRWSPGMRTAKRIGESSPLIPSPLPRPPGQRFPNRFPSPFMTPRART